MTTDEWIQHINHSLARAVEHDSGIDVSVLEVPGFSTGVMRRAWNNIASGCEAYLEVGAYFGGTACAAINNNPNLRTHIFENGSQEFDGRPIIDELRQNLQRHGKDYALSTDDFFDSYAAIKGWPDFDFYFYDGHHDQQWQARALPHAFPALADSFLFAVDDASWDSVRDGTAEGFMTLHGKMEIIAEWNLRGAQKDNDPVWWNGVDLFLCQKKCA